MINIIKTSNNIEDLCDFFIYKTNQGRLLIREKHKELVIFIGDEKPIAYYGAILTEGSDGEPIIKSVSRMKGVLPNGEIDWELLGDIRWC